MEAEDLINSEDEIIEPETLIEEFPKLDSKI